MIEIRIHGRGGQGAVTTGQIMAIAAFYDRKYPQTFPMFGVERSGAPVEAFVRMDDKPINLRCQIYEPDIVLVLEPSLLDAVDVAKGIRKGGTIIINTTQKPEEMKIKGEFNIQCIDATATALKIFGKAIVNTAILGAFAAITKDVSIESLKKAIDDKFLKTKGKDIAELNKKAVDEVYRQADEKDN